MASTEEWVFPSSLRPNPENLEFDLNKAINSVVKIKARISTAAFTAEILGTERIGSGVLINDQGLILTVGYLLTEADSIWVTTNFNQSIQAHVVAYDQATGLGLLQTLGPIDIEGSGLAAGNLPSPSDRIYFSSYGGIEHALQANIIRIDEFAGYWEYVLDKAIYTSPPHPQWGGAAIFNGQGHIIGIGSLFLQEIYEGQDQQGNLVIPTHLLAPIMQDLLECGRSLAPARPWLGVYTIESEGKLLVSSLARHGPGEIAGVLKGDQIIGIGEVNASGLANFFRTVWSLGSAGVSVPLRILRKGNHLDLVINSIDRNEFLIKPQTH